MVTVRALSTLRVVVCELDEPEHARRQKAGLIPTADALLLHCRAHVAPSFLQRPSPVRIRGAVAVRASWRSARANLAGFAAFGARVAVLPAKVAHRDAVRAESIYHGFGLLAAEKPQEVIQAPDAYVSVERTWAHRLVEEIVYDALLSQQTVQRRDLGSQAFMKAGGSQVR
ncbi:hypothetical protein HNP84_000530 [Thermocatellispora tengchongensis]|uniref:Uncharacterized protein n=1 Tax=Thermocatellispora tengchongensis TaxID=1073253 RepID=A0A840NUA7_9ACTN|nr:hypothetical protein [Thermocatellispora tengchongensis]MBB5130842.1 hypothetical protein [Thermocatellispora tengchongensis]